MADNNVHFVAGNICRHLACALDQSKVMAAAREIAAHFAAQGQDAEPVAVLRREIGESSWFDHSPLRPGSAEHREVQTKPEWDYCPVYAYAHPPSAQTEFSGNPGYLSDDEILQVFADVVGNQEPDARFIDVDRDQAIRIAHELLRRGAAQAQAQAEPVSGADGLPYFAEKIIEKLARADECFSEGEGADIGRHWLDMLTQLGLLNRVQINPAIWEITVQGEEVLHGHSNRL